MSPQNLRMGLLLLRMGRIVRPQIDPTRPWPAPFDILAGVAFTLSGNYHAVGSGEWNAHR